MKHEGIQPNGVCWDCGSEGACPTFDINVNKTVITIGWKCECGRWWPVEENDMLNWAKALVYRVKFVRGGI